MKRTKRIAMGLVFVMLMISIAGCGNVLVEAAETLTSENWEYVILADETVEITDYKGKETEVVIPDEIDGKSVVRIGDNAFEGCSSITSINIPSSVTSIGNNAFEGCSSDLTIYGKPGSYAEEYVKANGMEFKCSHTLVQVITKATAKKNGAIEEKCSACGHIEQTKTIYAASKIKLSKTSFTYNGKNRKPTVILKDSKGKTLPTGSYKIAYPKTGKNVGEYTVTVTLQGNYSGTVKLTYQITPKSTNLSKLTAKEKGFIAKWKKQMGQTTGYELQYSTDSKFKGAKTVTIKKNKTTSKSLAKLKAGKKYYVRIRTYKTVKIDGKSVKLCSGWSKAKSMKISSGSGGGSATTPTTHTHKWKKHTATKKVWVSKMVTVNDYEERQKVVRYYMCNCGTRFEEDEIEALDKHAEASMLNAARNGTLSECRCGGYLIYREYVTEKVKVGSHKEDHGHYKNTTYVDYYYCDCGAKK